MRTPATDRRTSPLRPYEQIVLARVEPSIADGRFPAKAIVGEPCVARARVFRHGHERIRVTLQLRRPGAQATEEWPMRPVNPGLDEWATEFPLNAPGRHAFSIVAWTDVFASWVDEFRKRVDAAQADIGSETAEGLAFLERMVAHAEGEARREASALLDRARAEAADPALLLALVSAPAVGDLAARLLPRSDEVRSDPDLEIMADRPLARLGAWYELFVRSQSGTPGRSGTFADAARRLPDLKTLGFDVIYLAPIHPIGFTSRKGRNNSVVAGPGDPGSPWAIGSPAGGHTAVEPALGTLDDFDRFVGTARNLGLEVALDLAIQCSPDHPWVTTHPEWFYRRPDGSIRFAENPPKKYQDIYPINFDTADWEALWHELRDVVRFWIAHGVTIFRVDNPHTKPIGFWRWLIDEIHRDSPEVIFLAEAFTRPPMMQALGERGFTQSYTYFTWRTTKAELTEYMTELASPEVSRAFRPNFFANTPDILPWILQQGGRAAFMSRLVLAATLSPSYGIYSGYELCEHEALPGREEYRDSEKYEIKVRDWQAPGNLNDLIRRVNTARQANPALHRLDNIRFLEVDSDQIIAYLKTTPDHANAVIVVVNLDPFAAHAATVEVPEAAIGVAAGAAYEVHDRLSDRTFIWGARNYVQLNPAENQVAHLLVVGR